MTHDYDFGGYLSPVGEPRPEMVEARVLAAVTRTLGHRLARAVPVAADDAYTTAAPTSASPSRLLLDGGGTLLGVTNLGADAATAILPRRRRRAVGDVRPWRRGSCAFVLRDLPLYGYGLPGTLASSTADLVAVGPDGLELTAHGPSLVALRADGSGTDADVVTLDAPRPGAPVTTTVHDGTTVWDVVVRHPQDVPGPDGTRAPGARRPHGRAGRGDADHGRPAARPAGTHGPDDHARPGRRRPRRSASTADVRTTPPT